MMNKIEHKIILILKLCFALIILNNIAFSQVDSSGVFVIGGDVPVEEKSDTILVKRRDITNCLKFDAGRIYSEVYILSFEHLIDNDRWSLEYELSFDIETDKFWYDWYTDYKITEPENNTQDFDAGFRSQIDFVFGGAIALKHYLSKRKSGIYGWYAGFKIKERYGQSTVSNNSGFGTFTVLEYKGSINLFETSLIFGYSMCLWDLVIIDPFLGPSAILCSTRYGTFEQDLNGLYWNENKTHRILPALHFGMRIGVPVDGIGSLFF